MQLPRTAAKLLPIAAIALTLALFTVIAALQSRWISRLSEAELQRAKIRLQLSVRAVQTDINRELTRAHILFQWESGAPSESWPRRTAEAYDAWTQTAQFPALIRRVLLLRPAASGELRADAYDPRTRGLVPIVWPPALADLRRQLALPFTTYHVFGARTFTGIALADAPAMVLALNDTIHKALPSTYPDATAWLVLELDQQLLLSKILPQALADNLDQPDQFDYQVTRDGFPNRIVYRSNPAAALTNVDASCTLLETRREYVRSEKGGTGRGANFPFGENPAEKRRMDGLHLWLYTRVDLPGVPPAPPMEGGVWQLQVQHRAGGLEAAAAQMRRGNLLLGFAMLALVAANLGILGWAARRAHRLGEARLQFAAGISHELRTPLAAICSAADNLAAGVTHEPSKVRQYGAAILDQGRQLTGMVEQILTFTGGQLKKHYELEPLDPAAVVRQAIAAVSPAARMAGVAIEEQIPAGLPVVLGDANALRQALVNLLNNAVRYASAGRWVGVSVTQSSTGEFEIRIADRGAGIPARELKRIFEPFYRVSDSACPQRRGSGLGLTIVQQTARAHGGRVSVESEPGRGSCFTLHLPVPTYATANSHSGR